MEADPSRPTPAIRLADGIDYVKMPWWKVLKKIFRMVQPDIGYGGTVDNYGIPAAKEETVLDNIATGSVYDFCSDNLYHAGSGRVFSPQADIL